METRSFQKQSTVFFSQLHYETEVIDARTAVVRVGNATPYGKLIANIVSIYSCMNGLNGPESAEVPSLRAKFENRAVLIRFSGYSEESRNHFVANFAKYIQEVVGQILRGWEKASLDQKSDLGPTEYVWKPVNGQEIPLNTEDRQWISLGVLHFFLEAKKVFRTSYRIAAFTEDPAEKGKSPRIAFLALGGAERNILSLWNYIRRTFGVRQ